MAASVMSRDDMAPELIKLIQDETVSRVKSEMFVPLSQQMEGQASQLANLTEMMADHKKFSASMMDRLEAMNTARPAGGTGGASGRASYRHNNGLSVFQLRLSRSRR